MLHNSITDIPGIRVGHAHDETALTGCTVVLCESGAVAGVDQRGGAPGTRETDALHPMHLVQEVHAVVLSGGSAFGLDCAGGAVRYLEERGIGFNVGVARVPIVPAAILFDLGLGRADVRPDAAMAYRACQAASTDPPAEGNFGAGMGATVGKGLGMKQAMKAGIGSASLEIAPGLRVGALAAVNAFGDVIDPQTGAILAGTRTLVAEGKQIGRGEYFADTLYLMGQRQKGGLMQFDGAVNTVIGVVATSAPLTKEGANKVAQMAQDGLARTVRPSHTMLDGDTIFALSVNQPKPTGGTLRKRAGSDPSTIDISTIGAFAAEVFAQAIVQAVRAAAPVAGLPSAGNLLASEQ